MHCQSVQLELQSHVWRENAIDMVANGYNNGTSSAMYAVKKVSAENNTN